MCVSERKRAQDRKSLTSRMVQLDRREAELRAEQQRKNAAQAQAALWDQSGISRAVRSQLLLSDVLAERETQIAERTYIAGVAEAQEGQFLAQLQEQLQVIGYFQTLLPPA